MVVDGCCDVEFECFSDEAMDEVALCMVACYVFLCGVACGNVVEMMLFNDLLACLVVNVCFVCFAFGCGFVLL